MSFRRSSPPGNGGWVHRTQLASTWKQASIYRSASFQRKNEAHFCRIFTPSSIGSETCMPRKKSVQTAVNCKLQIFLDGDKKPSKNFEAVLPFKTQDTIGNSSSKTYHICNLAWTNILLHKNKRHSQWLTPTESSRCSKSCVFLSSLNAVEFEVPTTLKMRHTKYRTDAGREA